MTKNDKTLLKCSLGHVYLFDFLYMCQDRGSYSLQGYIMQDLSVFYVNVRNVLTANVSVRKQQFQFTKVER